MDSFKRKIRWFWLIILALALVFFAFSAVVPSGHKLYTKTFDKPYFWQGRGHIEGFTPSDRLDQAKGNLNVITGDPVYFSLAAPRKFDRAKLKLSYINTHPERNKIIEAGVLMDKNVWRYNLKPLENDYLTELLASSTKSQGMFLWQKENKFSSPEEFLNNLPLEEKIVLYNYNLEKPAYWEDNFLSLAEKAAWPREFSLPLPLRGGHSAYLYLFEEGLNLNFSYYDLNENSNRGGDPLNFYLYDYNGNLVAQEEEVDDGIISDRNLKSETKEVSLNFKELKRGIYRLEFKANDDIVLDNLWANAPLLFSQRLWLYGSGQGDLKPLELWTDSALLLSKATKSASKQTLDFGGEKQEISEIYRQYEVFNASEGEKKIILEKNELLLENTGCFSFFPGIINPEPGRIYRGFNPDNFSYALFSYQTPRQEGDTSVAEAEFDISSAYGEDGKYSFIISIPGLKAEDGINDSLIIEKIELELYGKSLKQKIREFLNF